MRISNLCSRTSALSKSGARGRQLYLYLDHSYYQKQSHHLHRGDEFSITPRGGFLPGAAGHSITGLEDKLSPSVTES